MAEVVSLEEHFAIVADTDYGARPRRVLKHGDTFGVFDLHGDMGLFGMGAGSRYGFTVRNGF